MHRGYIKLWRKFEDWEWYTKQNMVHFFIHLLMKANYVDKKWRGKEIKRGQYWTSLDKLKAETGLSEQNIRTCIKNLLSTNEITDESTNEGRLITLVNYEIYNNEEYEPNNPINEQINQQSTDDQQTPNKPLTPTNNINKENKEKKGNKEKNKKEIFFPEWFSENLIFEFKEYEKMRKLIKKPMTDHAKDLTIKDLEKLSDKKIDIAISILNQSIKKGWQDIYALKPIEKIESLPAAPQIDLSHIRENIKNWRGEKPKEWKKMIVSELCVRYNRDIFSEVAKKENLKTIEDPEVYLNSIIEELSICR